LGRGTLCGATVVTPCMKRGKTRNRQDSAYRGKIRSGGAHDRRRPLERQPHQVARLLFEWLRPGDNPLPASSALGTHEFRTADRSRTKLNYSLILPKSLVGSLTGGRSVALSCARCIRAA